MAMSENFSPSPVSVMTPTMMPAHAQVAAMPTDWIAPWASVFTSLRGVSAESRRKNDTATPSTIA